MFVLPLKADIGQRPAAITDPDIPTHSPMATLPSPAVGEAVNTPPPKGGGFRLRLEAGLIDPSGRFSQTTLKLSSGLYGAFFVKGGAHHFVAPLFVDSFVRPAPRAFFRPDRILAVAVARSEGQGRRFFSAAEGLSLTHASTAANCP